MITKNTCVYCEEVKEVTLHDGELVCYDCRLDFLEQEFGQSSSKEIPAELEEMIQDLGIVF